MLPISYCRQWQRPVPSRSCNLQPCPLPANWTVGEWGKVITLGLLPTSLNSPFLPHTPTPPPTTFNSQLHICQLNREQKGNESIVSHPILSDLSFVYAALSENYKLFTYEVVNARAFSDMTDSVDTDLLIWQCPMILRSLTRLPLSISCQRYILAVIYSLRSISLKPMR